MSQIKPSEAAREETPAISRHQHWENIYHSKSDQSLSWHQEEPATPLALIAEAASPDLRVIDVGGGSSMLAARLLDKGFRNVAVLDISEAALNRAKSRIGARAELIRWIAADVTAVGDIGQFDVWHDRAVFHFLTDPEDRRRYAALAERTIPVGGHLIIATFALDGPERCSGLPVHRYDAKGLAREFMHSFALEKELPEIHITPGGKPQSFIYAVFRRV
jgi:2-polyprenyl-3-methyl-5-hydroxy-6-metoxy-1,4-benzoquinol methylase